MKGLKTLIRIHKQQLDEKRKSLAELQTQKLRLEQALEKTCREFEQEKQLVERMPDMGIHFETYAKMQRQKLENIKESIRDRERGMLKMEEEIRVLFSDLKKYDIALEQAEKKQASEEKRRETIHLDDLAQERFRRQQKEE